MRALKAKQLRVLRALRSCIAIPESLQSLVPQHDMYIGPCACGAWHDEAFWTFAFQGLVKVELYRLEQIHAIARQLGALGRYGPIRRHER